MNKIFIALIGFSNEILEMLFLLQFDYQTMFTIKNIYLLEHIVALA